MDSIDEVRDLISAGHTIRWVGYHSPRAVWVHLHGPGGTIRKAVRLEEDYTEPDFIKIEASAADVPGSVTGTIWNSNTRLELLRLASILGIGPGGSAHPGVGQEFTGSMGCIMAYDIEQDRSRLPTSSFPTPSESILSIACRCSCGSKLVLSIIPGIRFDYVVCESSADTVSKFIEYVRSHSPQWLVGYNNFRYDNVCLAYHADIERYDSLFIRMRAGSGSSLSYSYYIDIEGVYNIDILTYLDKTRRSSYPNMSLSTLASYHGAGDKMDFDTSDVQDFERLLEYNLHDSLITMRLALLSGMLDEITSLAIVSCSPIIDCVRFVSGTIAACSIASYCLSRHICMDWSPCTTVQEYRGAEVLKPIVGTHKDVVSCDFSSMYPTVLIGANISIENCVAQISKSPDGRVQEHDTGVSFSISGLDFQFDGTMQCIVPPVMQLFVSKRRNARKTKPIYAMGLKVAANSIYGSLGDRNSRIYSPQCSSSVTAGGRWCLAAAECILRKFKYQIVYGDTDSCFVARDEGCTCAVEDATSILSRIFSFTPFPGMSMDVDKAYDKIVFLGKKTYFGRASDGSMVSKGMSQSRKDRIGICRSFMSIAIPLTLSDMEGRMKRRILGDMVCTLMDSATRDLLRVSHVSKIVKKDGSNYYEYRNRDGARSFAECESVPPFSSVEYSAGFAILSVSRELSSVLALTGIGSMADVVREADVI